MSGVEDSPTEVWVRDSEGKWCFRNPETGELVRRTWQAVFTSCRIPMTALADDELECCLLRINIDGPLHRVSSQRLIISPQAARMRKAELMRRAMEHNDALVARYMKVFEDIAMDDQADAQHRLRAAEAGLDRIIGKAPQKIDVTADVAVWEQGIGGLLVDTIDPSKEDTNASNPSAPNE